MPKYNLFNRIIENSKANKWQEAKKEWVLDHIYDAKEAQECLCGHYPIIEICVIRNKINNEHLMLGNCCIKRIFNMPTKRMFVSIKKVAADMQKSVNKDVIEYAHRKTWLNDWELSFYINIWRKRKLSEKQMNTKIKINRKLINEFSKGSEGKLLGLFPYFHNDAYDKQHYRNAEHPACQHSSTE